QTAETEGLAGLAGSRKILVCTDLASRGLDTTCVTHVVLFDFPTTAIDYLHRSGRTARAGTRGKVTALVGKKDRRLADQIRLAIRQGGVIN
ncbi:DEAD-box ATP-dependent RNA helicase 39, partial [Coemansia sp. RSA 2681]